MQVLKFVFRKEKKARREEMTLSSGPVHGGLLSIFYLCDNVLSSPISMKMKITGDTNIQKKLIFTMPTIKDILNSEGIFEV